MSKCIYGNTVGVSTCPKSFVLEAEDGTELVGVVVDDVTVFTADASTDIREGTVAATDKGIVTGSKVIPSYNTSEGCTIIMPDTTFEIKSLKPLNKYDFTKLQVIICPFAGSIDDSVSAEKVSINGKVYETNSDVVIAEVTKDDVNKHINFGIKNESDSLYVLRYFTYKEIY